jgi:hypothetical protein
MLRLCLTIHSSRGRFAARGSSAAAQPATSSTDHSRMSDRRNSLLAGVLLRSSPPCSNPRLCRMSHLF